MTKNQRQQDDGPSVGAVGATDLEVSLAVFVRRRYVDVPRVAAHLAVLNQRAADLWFEIDLDLLTTVRTGHHEDGLHRYMMRHHPHKDRHAWSSRSRARSCFA